MSEKHQKKVVVLGASSNPSRYSNRAVKRLVDHGHEVVAIGRTAGKIHGVEILTGKPEIDGVDTVTVYLNPKVQELFKDYIKSLNAKRVIFNPGAEHEIFQKELLKAGSEPIEACTLVMLSTGSF